MPYHHLTPKERYWIALQHSARFSVRKIARIIGRSPSTVSRELRRNKGRMSSYWYDWAQSYANQRKAIPRHTKRLGHIPLYDIVCSSIRNGLSPEQISGRLKREYRSSKMRVSPETIYRWIVRDAANGGTLYLSLVRKHKKRRKQRGSLRRRLFAGRVSVGLRPLIVDQRRRFGDWESDSLEGAKSKGGLATHTERKSRYLVAAKLEDKKSATFMDASIKAFEAIDHALIKTYTVDNGSEFARFKDLENSTNSKVYFADLYSPWQRGLNENTNGLLRRYFPKGCNFHAIDDSIISQAISKINNRPRKCLNYRTPYEVLFKTKSVALGC